MASKKLVKAIMEIIAPDVAELLKIKEAARTDEQAEALADVEEDILDVIEAVEEHQATTMRLLVVGQVRYDGSEELHTVALGPYGARGTLSDQDKFKKAAEASTRAHDQGGRLAWDVRTGRGKGRYMVVPLLRTPRDAWDFYRAGSGVGDDELEPVVQNIEASIRGSILDEILPACTCGVRPESGHQSVQGVRVTRKCYRHVGDASE